MTTLEPVRGLSGNRLMEIYATLCQMRDEGVPLTLRAMMKRFNIRSMNGMVYHLRMLERAGLLFRYSNTAAGVVLHYRVLIYKQEREPCPATD